MTYTARIPTTAFIPFKIASSVLEESGFGFADAFVRGLRLWNNHMLWLYLDPCSLASDKRPPPVNDHIFLIFLGGRLREVRLYLNDVSLNKSHAVLLSCSLVQNISFPSLDS